MEWCCSNGACCLEVYGAGVVVMGRGGTHDDRMDEEFGCYVMVSIRV